MGPIKANAIITVHRHQPTKKKRKKGPTKKNKNLSKQQPNWTDNHRTRVEITIVKIITLI